MRRMSLLLRLNLALVVVFAAAATVTGFACRAVLQRNAEHEIGTTAELMLDSALAVRDYTATEIAPLLEQQMQTKFLPQSIPFYAATEHFLRLHASRPEYSYQEATLNPTDLRDRAADWQADIIERFRNDPRASQFSGERATPLGLSLYLAKPIRATTECLECHSTANSAPRPLVARYGANNGFGWQVGDVVGAQVVSVPVASAETRATTALHAFVGSLVGVFLALLLVVNLVIYLLVMRPVRRMAKIADRLSVGDITAPDFPTGGGAEIAALGHSFNRMRTSLAKATELLEN